jgi:membrane protease YdiL (CAAX protease family)
VATGRAADPGAGRGGRPVPLGGGGVAAAYLGALSIAWGAQAVWPGLRPPSPASYLVSPLALLLACHGVLLARRVPPGRRPPWSAPRWAVGLQAVAAGIALKFAGDAVAAVERPLVGPLRGNNPLVLQPHVFVHPAAAAVLVAAVVCLVPVAEELFFRGMLYAWLRSRMGLTAAVAVDAILFGAAHGQAALLAPLAVVGAGLCLLYERSATLWVPALAHAAVNAVALALAA